MNRVLQTFVVFLSILASIVGEHGNHNAAAVQTKPTLLDVKEYKIVTAGSNWSLRCDDDHQVEWYYTKHENIERSKIVQHTARYNETLGRQVHEIILQVRNSEAIDTGNYTCRRINDTSTSVSAYVYVYDKSKLLLPVKPLVYMVQSNPRAVIPCLPTHPNVSIELWKISPACIGHCKLPKSKKMKKLTLDPMRGLIVPYPKENYDGTFRCEANYEGFMEFSNRFYIIWIREKCKKRPFDRITYDFELEESHWTGMEYPNGTRDTVTCDDGFEIFPLRPIITNAATTICVNGYWKPDIDKCIAARCSCTKLPQEMIERKRKFKYCDQFVPSGTYDEMTECEEGYKAEGNYGARCAWGVWSIHTPVTQYNRCIRNNSVNDCRLDLKGKDDLTAVYRDHTFEGQEVDFVHRSTVKFTCKSFYFTLEGAKNATCMDGEWSKETPACKRTSGFDFVYPPFLWVYFTNFNHMRVDDGRIMIPKETLFSIGCWSPHVRQLKLHERNSDGKQMLKVNVSTEDILSSVKIIDPVEEKTEATVECINSNGISTEFNIVIADTCEIDENELNRRGLQVVPDSRQRIYVEGDKIQVECSSNERTTDRFIIICKPGREWEYANHMDC